jgi:hypothetical protein
MFNGFDLDNDNVFDDQVQSISAIELYIPVDDGKRFLLLDFKSTFA